MKCGAVVVRTHCPASRTRAANSWAERSGVELAGHVVEQEQGGLAGELAGGLQLGDLEGEDERAGLALAGEGARGLAAELHVEVVAVGPHGGGAAGEVLAPRSRRASARTSRGPPGPRRRVCSRSGASRARLSPWIPQRRPRSGRAAGQEPLAAGPDAGADVGEAGLVGGEQVVSGGRRPGPRAARGCASGAASRNPECHLMWVRSRANRTRSRNCGARRAEPRRTPRSSGVNRMARKRP
jgi:hypothetical protein